MRQPTNSAEVYDVLKNTWNDLPNMPRKGDRITCVGLQNQILISSKNFRLMSFDIGNAAYSLVAVKEHCGDIQNRARCIGSSKDKLYLFEFQKIFEMNEQYEVIDTITTANEFVISYERQHFHTVTNKAGQIFLIDLAGRVSCFDPLTKQQTRVQDLSKDYYLSERSEQSCV